MIKIMLKGAGTAEKPKVYIDGEAVGKVSNSKPLTLNLDSKKHLLVIKNMNGSSVPLKVEDPGEDDISLFEFRANTLRAFKEGYFGLVSGVEATSEKDTRLSDANKDDTILLKANEEDSNKRYTVNKKANPVGVVILAIIIIGGIFIGVKTLVYGVEISGCFVPTSDYDKKHVASKMCISGGSVTFYYSDGDTTKLYAEHHAAATPKEVWITNKNDVMILKCKAVRDSSDLICSGSEWKKQ